MTSPGKRFAEEEFVLLLSIVLSRFNVCLPALAEGEKRVPLLDIPTVAQVRWPYNMNLVCVKCVSCGFFIWSQLTFYCLRGCVVFRSPWLLKIHFLWNSIHFNVSIEVADMVLKPWFIFLMHHALPCPLWKNNNYSAPLKYCSCFQNLTNWLINWLNVTLLT